MVLSKLSDWNLSRPAMQTPHRLSLDPRVVLLRPGLSPAIPSSISMVYSSRREATSFQREMAP
jgi:hypothetical protein